MKTHSISKFFSGRVEIPEERRLVINPTTQPTLETRPSRMNEVNSDFADRSQFHQAHTVQGRLHCIGRSNCPQVARIFCLAAA